MILGGLQKNSFIDFPGKISCVLFLTGCNFDCPYCHNPDLARGCSSRETPPDEAFTFDFLHKRRGFLDGVVISGGEPTLQSDLPDICRRVKNLGYPVKLDTNGSRPEVLQRLIDRDLVDYVSMDIKTDPIRYQPMIAKACRPDQILSSIHLVMDAGIPYEFRTTCVKPIVDEQVMENIGRTIQGAKLYILQQFRETEVLHPEFFRNTDRHYTEEGLEYLKSIVEPWVEQCIIR